MDKHYIMQFKEIYTAENQNKPIEWRGNEKSPLTQIKLNVYN